MSPRVVFVDTTILCNLLEVPGKSQNVSEVKRRFADCRGSVVMILPVTAVIETGNHVAQLKNGFDRRSCAEKFTAVLRRTLDHEAPWVLNTVEWGDAFLRSLLSGAGSQTSLIELAAGGIGCGDRPSSPRWRVTVQEPPVYGSACGPWTESSPDTAATRFSKASCRLLSLLARATP